MDVSQVIKWKFENGRQHNTNIAQLSKTISQIFSYSYRTDQNIKEGNSQTKPISSLISMQGSTLNASLKSESEKPPILTM